MVLNIVITHPTEVRIISALSFPQTSPTATLCFSGFAMERHSENRFVAQTLQAPHTELHSPSAT